VDPAYLSAIAALAGSTIGGMTTLAASWLTHHVQFTAQERAASRNRREDLYKSFIEEASKLYADAYEHDQAQLPNFVNVYALVSRMRVLSSPPVIESADRVVRIIFDTYLAPNKTFRQLVEQVDHDAVNPLREFGEACRKELGGRDRL
jgi:hypothetical protein